MGRNSLGSITYPKHWRWSQVLDILELIFFLSHCESLHRFLHNTTMKNSQVWLLRKHFQSMIKLHSSYITLDKHKCTQFLHCTCIQALYTSSLPFSSCLYPFVESYKREQLFEVCWSFPTIHFPPFPHPSHGKCVCVGGCRVEKQFVSI